MDFLDLMNTLEETREIGLEKYFNMNAILETINKNNDYEYRIVNSLLLTPFYIDEGTYELYYYDLNIYLHDDNCPCEIGFKDKYQLLKRDHIINVNRSHPYVKQRLISEYILLLFKCEQLKNEVSKVFEKRFNEANMYFAIY